MLVLSRKESEEIIIFNPANSEPMRVRVVSIKGSQAKIGIDAPQHIIVDRKEIFEQRLVNDFKYLKRIAI